MENQVDACPAPQRARTRVPLRIEEMLAGIAIGLLALITFGNVLVRYLTNFSFAFTEEFSIFLMLFMGFVGASSVMAKGGHLNISFFVDKLSPPFRRRLRIATTAVTAVMFTLLVVLGGLMAYDEYRFEVTSPGLGIPTWVYTIWMPILSTAVVGRAIGLIIRIRRERA